MTEFWYGFYLGYFIAIGFVALTATVVEIVVTWRAKAGG